MLTNEKIAALKRLFGDELAEEIIANIEQKSQLIEQLGVEYKDFSPVSENDAAPAVEAVDRIEADVKTLLLDIIDENGQLVQMTSDALAAASAAREAVKELRAVVEELRAIVDERPRSVTETEGAKSVPDALQHAVQRPRTYKPVTM